MRNILSNAENLRAFGADFDYTDRTAYLLVDAPNAVKYLERHANGSATSIADAGSSVQHELAIRDMAIDFFKEELESVTEKALTFLIALRLTKLMAESGVEVPDDIKVKVAGLLRALERAVAPEGVLPF